MLPLRAVKACFMKSKNRLFCTVSLVIGLCLLAGGIYGFFSLADAADDYLNTTGVVERVDSKKIYKHRKIRVENKVSVRYKTTLYGELSTTLNFYVPFLMDEGDEIDILYNPRLPRYIRLPGWESLLYGLLLAGGLGATWLSVYMWRCRKE